MPKPMYVWSGSAWVSVASEVESLAGYATQSYADNTPGMKLVVPTSVAVGSGSGSVATQGTVSFSGASSVSLNGCFSSAYRNYRIICNFAPSVSNDVNIRVRVSGTDDTGSNYKFAAIGYKSNNTAYNDYGAAATSWQDIARSATSTTNVFFAFDVINPIETMPTIISGKTILYDTASSGVLTDINYTGFHTQSTSYTGLTLVTTTGTITGDVSVYGYKKG
jgi:hypothetical protein